ncbi:hypothetical protein [Diaminobutyricibacter sp. McL0608]|uniref:hypothetical protein n=1 Tax=Leifsonia sp. McL0608 TaxID=3143537 RepID=UPI0031F2F0AC
MTFPPARDLDAVATALATLRALEAEEGAALSEAQLLVRSLAALGSVRAAVEAVALRRIASLDRACELDPETSPIRSSGYRDLESLLAELWRTSLPAARQLCGVARAVAPRHSLHGDELPAEFPELAAALLGTDSDDAGSRDDDRTVDEAGGEDAALPTRVSVEQAAVIIRELGKTGPGCSLEQRTYGERVLVDHAPGLTVEETRRLAIQVRDRLDRTASNPAKRSSDGAGR